MAEYRAMAVQSAGIDKSNRYWNEHGVELHYLTGSKKMAMVSFEIADSWKRKAIDGYVYLYLYGKGVKYCITIICPVLRAFDATTVAWSTAYIDELTRLSQASGGSDEPALLTHVIDIKAFDTDRWRGLFLYGAEISVLSNPGAVYGANSSLKPYLSFSASPVKLNVAGGNPQKGAFLNPSAGVNFTIHYTQETRDQEGRCIVAPKYAHMLVHWRIAGEESYREVAFPDPWATGLYFPPGTFPAQKNLQWRVQITSDDGVVGDFSPWLDFTTIDSRTTAQAVAPISTYLAGNEANTFSWRHISPTGTLQTAAQLETTADGITWVPLVTVSGGVQQTVLPAGSLSGATTAWRVRTANRDGTYGDYSDPAPISVYAAPATPVLEQPEAAPRITLRWQSSEQQTYQLRGGDWLGPMVWSSAKVANIPRWFADGPVTVGVRVQSSQGLWSEWATTTVQVRNQPQAEVILSTAAVDNGALLRWSGSHEAYTIYRDGVAIHTTTATEFVDYYAAGAARYQVRGIVGRYYALSREATEISKTLGAVIGEASTLQWIALRYRRGSSPTHSASTSRPVVLQAFAGRTRPVAEVGEQWEVQHTLDYSVATIQQVRQLEALVGCAVLVKEGTHTALQGVLLSVDRSGDWAGFDLTLTLAETAQKEGSLF